MDIKHCYYCVTVGSCCYNCCSRYTGEHYLPRFTTIKATIATIHRFPPTKLWLLAAVFPSGQTNLTLKGEKETSHMNLQLPGQQGLLLRQTGHPRVAVNNALEPDCAAELEPSSWWNKNHARYRPPAWKSRRRFHTAEQEKMALRKTEWIPHMF